jgi:hypothetical protein
MNAGNRAAARVNIYVVDDPKNKTDCILDERGYYHGNDHVIPWIAI